MQVSRGKSPEEAQLDKTRRRKTLTGLVHTAHAGCESAATGLPL